MKCQVSNFYIPAHANILGRDLPDIALKEVIIMCLSSTFLVHDFLNC